MLWRAMLRGTTVGLLTEAARCGGATVQSSKDTPVPAGTGNWFVVYADDEMEGEGGGAPTFRTKGIVTVEITAEAASRAEAEALLDTLTELVKRTLLGGQGFSVVLTVAQGSARAVPASGSPNLYRGYRVRGPGIPEGADFLAIESVNVDDTITLSAAYPGVSGDIRFNIGSFIALFERIDEVKSFPEYKGSENKKHIVMDTVEFHGHVHELFEPAIAQNLNGLNLYIDSVNIFDPNEEYPAGEFPTGEPFTGIAAAPRTSGPDGRPEVGAQIDLST